MGYIIATSTGSVKNHTGQQFQIDQLGLQSAVIAKRESEEPINRKIASVLLRAIGEYQSTKAAFDRAVEQADSSLKPAGQRWAEAVQFLKTVMERHHFSYWGDYSE